MDFKNPFFVRPLKTLFDLFGLDVQTNQGYKVQVLSLKENHTKPTYKL